MVTWEGGGGGRLRWSDPEREALGALWVAPRLLQVSSTWWALAGASCSMFGDLKPGPQ